MEQKPVNGGLFEFEAELSWKLIYVKWVSGVLIWAYFSLAIDEAKKRN